ncbi:MAG: MFS transporter [Alphaproteobacteria bacterium]
MTISSRLGSIGRALEDRNYRIHTVGYTASWLTFWGQRLATGWVAWELTGSPFLVGVAGFLDLVPVIVLGPLFAALADRLNRLTMVIISAWLGVVQAALLAALAFSGSMTYASLLVLVAMHGVVIALYMPSFSGLLPHLSAKRNLPAAIAFNSAIGSTAFFVGPALATWMIAADPGYAFASNAAGYAIYLVSLYRLTVKHAAARPAVRRSLFGDVGDGVRYAVAHKGIGPLLVLAFFAGLLFQSTQSLMPVIADGVHGRGEAGLGILQTLSGFGALAAAVWLSVRGRLEGTLALVLAAFALFAGAATLFALSPLFWPAALLIILFGGAQTVFRTGAMTLVQTAVDDAMRSRVVGAQHLLQSVAGAGGALGLGALAEVIGVGPALATAGIAAAAVFARVWRRRAAMALALPSRDDEEDSGPGAATAVVSPPAPHVTPGRTRA